MKRTQLIELLRLIQKTLVSFLSIVLFVSMGITLFAGMTWTTHAYEDLLDNAFDEGNAYDVQVLAKLGVTDAAVQSISQISGVSAVEPMYASSQTVTAGDEQLDCSVYSIPETISTLKVLEGALPSKIGEVALLTNSRGNCSYEVGDAVSFEADGDDAKSNDGMKYLKKKSYTVTAIVQSPDYLSSLATSQGVNGNGMLVDCVFYVPKDTFDAKAYNDSYPMVNVRSDQLSGLNTFDDAYKTESDSLLASVRQVGENLSGDRYTSVKGDADDKIADAQKKLAKAEKKIAKGKKKIADSEKKLADAKQKIANGQSKIANAQNELANAKRKIANGQRELAAGQKKLDNAKKKLAAGQKKIARAQKKLDNAKREIAAGQKKIAAGQKKIANAQKELDAAKKIGIGGAQIAAGQKKIAAGKKKLAASKKKLASAEAKYAAGKKKLDASKKKLAKSEAKYAAGKKKLDANKKKLASAKAKYAAGKRKLASKKRELADAKAKYADGEKKLADGKKELAEAKAKYADGEKKLADAKEKAENITQTGWAVSTRSSSVATQVLKTMCHTLSNLRLTMASLFVIVGLLVCYSAMSRLVYERMQQLGTKKALGFKLGEISKQFLGYAFLASALGIVLGALAGAPVVQMILIPKLNQFVLGAPGFVYAFGDIVLISIAQILLICFSAWLACKAILRKNAIDLLAGQRPSTAKHRFYEGWGAWKRLGLLTQTMVNNCFNDKRRVFGTLVGVAGCTALVVCAMTVQNGITITSIVQDEQIQLYEYVVYVNGQNEQRASGKTVDELLKANDYTSVKALRKISGANMPDGTKCYMTLAAPENIDDLSSVIDLQVGADSLPLSEKGVYISSALAHYYQYKVGDEFEFAGSDGATYKVPITGVFNYYGGDNMAFMSGDTYELTFDEKPTYDARLVKTGGVSAESFNQALDGAVDLDGVSDSRATSREVNNAINSLARTVVLVYVSISALVALFVLLNLNVMFVSEKKRELIVMMINGYSQKDAKKYVSRDSIIMNSLGMLVGCLLGTVMGIVAIQSMESDRLDFIASSSPLAWVIGIAVCTLFSVIVMSIALRRVNKFKLTSVND